MDLISLAHAHELRAAIEEAATYLPDETALQVQELYPIWKPGVEYAASVRVRYDSKLYKVVQAHTSQEGWEPANLPALFTEVAPPGEIPVWRQPTGAQDAYMKDDKVYYPDKDGSVYISLIDYNTWQPGVYGWEQI